MLSTMVIQMTATTSSHDALALAMEDRLSINMMFQGWLAVKV